MDPALPPPLLAATLTCPGCGATLPTFVEKEGPVTFYCAACRSYRTAEALSREPGASRA